MEQVVEEMPEEQCEKIKSDTEESLSIPSTSTNTRITIPHTVGAFVVPQSELISPTCHQVPQPFPLPVPLLPFSAEALAGVGLQVNNNEHSVTPEPRTPHSPVSSVDSQSQTHTPRASPNTPNASKFRAPIKLHHPIPLPAGIRNRNGTFFMCYRFHTVITEQYSPAVDYSFSDWKLGRY